MKTITRLLVTATLLFVGVGGVKVYAGKLYWSPSTAIATWTSATNTMAWTSSDMGGYHVMYTGFTPAVQNNSTPIDYSSYTKLHFTLSSVSSGSKVQVKFVSDGKEEKLIDLTEGENNLYFANYSSDINFSAVKEISMWGAGTDGGSAVITNVYMQKPANVVINNGFKEEITALDYITDGNKFVISDGAKAKYFYTNNENEYADVANVPADSYFYFTLEEYTGGDIPNSTDPATKIYRIKISNADGDGYPRGSDGVENCYLNAVLDWTQTVISGVQTGWGNNIKDALWYVTYDADKGFSFRNVYRSENAEKKSWLSVEDKFQEDKQYLKLYKSIDINVNSEVDLTGVAENVNITVGGENRSYQLYVPNNVADDCPLVISLHGANGASTNYTPFTREVADAKGCIVAYPQGKPTAFPIGFGGTTTGWTATGEDNFDVKFLKAVIEDVASKYSINRKRIYCCGFSNGGMMTYAMSNACSDEIAAFASISGYPINEFHLRHTGSRPVPFMHIHGKSDTFVLYSKMPTIVDEMVARMGANPKSTMTTVEGYTKNFYAAGDGSFPYVYYEINGMGHEAYTTNTEDGSSALTMWNFFKDYTLDSPSDETLKWAPRIEEEGYNPAEHGWTRNDGTTLLQFGGDQYTTDNKNVYHSLQFDNGRYKLSFTSTGEAGKTIGVKIEKLTGSKKVVLDKTVNVGDSELLFEITDGWGEYKLTMTRPSDSDNITVSNIVVKQTGEFVPKDNKTRIKLTGATGNPTIVPIAPSTLDDLYAATFTPTEDYSRIFRYQNLDVKEYDKIVIKFQTAVSGDWRINMPDGSYPQIAVGSTELEIDLSKYITYGDFTIFNWGSERSPIAISEAYFVRTYEVVKAVDFSSLTSLEGYWHGSIPEGGELEISAEDDALKVYNPSVLSQNYLFQYEVANGMTTVADEDYIVAITLKSTVAGDITCVLGDWDNNQNKSFAVEVGDEWVTKEVEFSTFPYNINNAAHILLQSGTLAGTILVQKAELLRIPEKNPIEKPERTATDAKTDVFAEFKTIDGDATWDSDTRFFTKKCGWQWDGDGIDLSQYRYLVITAGRNSNTDGASGLAWDYGKVTIKDKNNLSVSGDDYGAAYMNLWFSQWNNHNCLKIDLEKLRKEQYFDIYHIKELTILGDKGFILGNVYASNQKPNNDKNYGGEDNGDFKVENLPADKFGTICLPYQAAVAGAFVYEITGKNGNGITLTQYNDLLVAGKPYFFKSNASLKEATTETADTKNVYFYKATAATVESPVENNGLIGTFEDIKAPLNSYILSSNKLYKVDVDPEDANPEVAAKAVNVRAKKAYIDMSKIENVPSPARSIMLTFNDVTGVKELKNEKMTIDQVYTLSGQRVSTPTKGLYIVNGNKIIIK